MRSLTLCDILCVASVFEVLSLCLLTDYRLTDWSQNGSPEINVCHRCRLVAPPCPGMRWCLVAAKYSLTDC